jgi:hypothetical protein
LWRLDLLDARRAIVGREALAPLRASSSAGSASLFNALWRMLFAKIGSSCFRYGLWRLLLAKIRRAHLCDLLR